MINFDTIKAGLKNNEFFLEYLPTVLLEDKRCVGGEALIRWQNRSGIVPARDFIPLIENTPLSGLITYWVIDTVAQEMGDWLRDQDDVFIGINVPPEVLGRGGLEYAATKSSLIDVAHKIVLEVTERGVPDKLGIDGLHRTAGSGVRIALDDVDPDNANPIILSRVRVDIIKIDKSFSDRMLLDDWSPDRINGLSALVRTSNLDVIAEGVESAAQVEILRNAGIKMAQGWYFSKPLAAEDFKAYCTTHQ